MRANNTIRGYKRNIKEPLVNAQHESENELFPLVSSGIVNEQNDTPDPEDGEFINQNLLNYNFNNNSNQEVLSERT